jgi:hypothetical protein
VSTDYAGDLADQFIDVIGQSEIGLTLASQAISAARAWSALHDPVPHELIVLSDWLTEQDERLELPTVVISALLHRWWWRIRAAKWVHRHITTRLLDPERHAASGYPRYMQRRPDRVEKVVLAQIHAHGERYRFLISEGEIETAQGIRAHRRIWVRRALESRAARRGR